MRDKPSSLGRDPVDDREMRRWYRQRLRSLQSVDQAVAKAVRVLREQGVLRNTLIVFTSDNGFLLGEHRFATKNVPYEEAMQVPLLMRGPGVTRGVVTTKTATMIDLAPTFLDIAGVGGRSAMDGRSLFTTLLRRGYRKTLIQAGVGDRPWMYRGVRTPRWTYVRYADGFEELYDRRRDPYQLHNLVVTNPDARMRRKRAEFRTALRGLRNCAGATCRSRSFR
jgi:N-acetylglucosamine-6-sulfatase